MVLQHSIRPFRYIGESGDVKPVTLVDGVTPIPVGSTFLERDTKALFVCYDGTNWVSKDAMGEMQDTPTAYTLLRRLKDLITGIVLAAGTAVIGKVRLVSTDGTEITDDAANAITSTIVDGTGTDAIGAVTASPVSNTLLDRLKALLTGIILAAGSAVIGKVRLVSTDGSEVTLDSQNAISTVEKASIVHLEKPFGKGNLTSDGVQHSAEVTTNDAAWTTVESITIEPPATGADNIVEVEFGLTYSIKSSSTVKYVKHKAQARDKDGTWVDLYSEVTRAADASAYLEVTYSGRFKPVTDFDAVPFDVQIMIQREDAGENATGKVKNSSYVKVIYNAD